MIRAGVFSIALLLVSSGAWGTPPDGPPCRPSPEAVNLANEADLQKGVDVDGAISKYEEAVSLDPGNHQILYKLAMAYKKKEAWDNMAATMARATQLAPKWASYWYWRGEALEEQALKRTLSWDEVKDTFKKCVEMDPNYAHCYFELGTAYLYTDDEQAALANYTKAIQHKPDELQFYGLLADLYINLGYLDQAAQVLKQGLVFGKPGDKNLYDLHVLMSIVYQQKKQLSEMVSELETAKNVAGEGHPEIFFNLGATYAVLTPPRKADAIQLLKAFQVRACKGAHAMGRFKDQCEQAQALCAKMGAQP